MVIFGAGASYDSVPSRRPSRYIRGNLISRPPLATELFLADDFFAESLRRFPQCKPIVPYLQCLPGGETIEHTLEVLQAEGETDPERKRQIAAIRFYLHFVIWECERRWSDVAHGTTNYATLLDQLRRHRPPTEPVLLVTFNYDRMIEDALSSLGITINEVPDYIGNDGFKLFKLHGSTHWGREVDTPIDNIQNKNVWQVGGELIDKAADLIVSDRYHIVRDHPISKINDTPLFPAIAIPVETKRVFECPAEHLECLCSHISKVTKILVVGWRARERHFLDLLRQHTTQIPIQVVAGKKEHAEEVIDRIRDGGINISGEAADAGFTEYVISRAAERFFSI